jgi:ABC-type enterobactin transport system permease subunit
MQIRRPSKTKYIIVLIIILLIFIVVAASVGSAKLSLKETGVIIASFIPGINYFIDTSSLNPQSVKIISEIRLPRIFLAIFVGIALACAGVISIYNRGISRCITWSDDRAYTGFRNKAFKSFNCKPSGVCRSDWGHFPGL